MSITTYPSCWQSYWAEQQQSPGDVLWDSAPSDAAARDLPRLQHYFDPQLPLVDVGCGNGTQTAFLAQHFDSIIGSDVSSAAVALARASHPTDNVSFRPLDLLERPDVQSLNAEIGDANIYVRTVLQQFESAEQLEAARSLADLMGTSGRCYLIELSTAAKSYFRGIVCEFGRSAGLERICRHGITPGNFREDGMGSLFPPEDFTVLESGTDEITTTHRLPSGETVGIPAFYAVVARRQSTSSGHVPSTGQRSDPLAGAQVGDPYLSHA